MKQTPVEGVVAVIEREGKLLAIRRAAGVVAGGSWCLPGGAVQPGESPAEAVVREVREEVGLQVRADRRLWQWTRPDGLLRLTWWGAILPDDAPQPSPAPEEVAEIRWVRPEELRLLSPLLESNRAFLDFYQTGTVERHRGQEDAR
ncbi:MAG: NUDIX domain-containing protein [Phycisphaerae bacterium]|jgi:mutator protein MutT